MLLLKFYVLVYVGAYLNWFFAGGERALGTLYLAILFLLEPQNLVRYFQRFLGPVPGIMVVYRLHRFDPIVVKKRRVIQNLVYALVFLKS